MHQRYLGKGQHRPYEAARGSIAHCEPVINPKINEFLAGTCGSA